MSDALVLSSFTAHVGSTFRLVDADPVIEFELIEAVPLRTGPSGIDPERSFSLLFGGPADRPIAQEIVRLEHPELGDLELFVVPVAERDATRHYEAIVNRMS